MRITIGVKCKTCETEYQKRTDTLSGWSGNCRSCATALVGEKNSGPNHYRWVAKNKCVDCGKESKWIKEQTRCKLCLIKYRFQTPENHPRWKGGITTEKHRLRGKSEWKEWRTTVFARDNFTCKECGATGVYIEPHHILPIRSDRSRLFDIKNGITLCRPCHQKTVWKEAEYAEKYFALTESK